MPPVVRARADGLFTSFYLLFLFFAPLLHNLFKDLPILGREQIHDHFAYQYVQKYHVFPTIIS